MTRTLAALMTLWFSLPAQADEAGTQWLHRIDEAAKVSDAHIRLALDVTDARGVTTQREIEIWQKGLEQRLVRMIAPARLKGVGLLVGAKDSLHLFLPSYPPSRRVVGSKRANAFMGTDFAIEDLSRMTYSGRFEAVVGPTEGTHTRLDLTPLEETGADAVQLWVASNGTPTVHRIDHLDATGTASRRLTMSDFREVSGVMIAHQMKVEDLAKGRVTSGKVIEVKIGSGLQDRIFTVTHLERP